MSESDSDRSPFDIETLRELIALMQEHEVSEVNLKRGDVQWRLRRGPQEVAYAPAPPPAAAPPAPAPQPAAAGAAEPAGESEPEGTFILSPTVGTFYEGPSPDDPPFVKTGDKVEPDTVVCLVEAMKVFNQIQAEVRGTIAEILVQNGDPVEVNQKLFRVVPG